MYYTHDSGWGWGGGWGWEVGMIVAMLGLFALICFGAIWLMRSGGSVSHAAVPHTTAKETPIEILEHRLANGDITVEEYHQRRRALEQRGSDTEPPAERPTP